MTEKAHTRNSHDDGLDIVTGRDVASGTVVARVSWDTQPLASGLVLRWYEAGALIDEDLPDSPEEARGLIEARGYELDPDSAADITNLAR
jgi:hypothetical protein